MGLSMRSRSNSTTVPEHRDAEIAEDADLDSFPIAKPGLERSASVDRVERRHAPPQRCSTVVSSSSGGATAQQMADLSAAMQRELARQFPRHGR